MPYTVHVADTAGHAVSLKVDDFTIARPAIEVIFDVFGERPDKLVADGIIESVDSFNLRKLQDLVFDKDETGPFIRPDVNITAHGALVNPDEPLKNVCDRFGKSCSLIVESGTKDQEPVDEFSRLMMVYMLGIGRELDVTKDHPQLEKLIATLDQAGLLEIDVKRASYSLTPRGKQIYAQTMAEAKELENRFDIFADVDVDATGVAHFDTGLGQDLRAPMFELKGIEPFKGRLLLGMMAGEFDQLDDWAERISSRKWYDAIFEPIENAPSIEDLGKSNLESIAQQGNRALRQLQDD